MTRRFDDNRFFPLYEEMGKKIISPNFCIPPSHIKTIGILAIYFYNYDEDAKDFNIDLNKGIFLNGPIGCGKTSIMKIFKALLENSFRIITCKEIGYECIEKGAKIIFKYSKESQMPNNIWMPITYCFDDLGSEENSKHYGNKFNAVAEILSMRYEMMKVNNMKTHITSNLHAKAIEELYGSRLRSRFKEMFNLVSFDKNSPDLRD